MVPDLEERDLEILRKCLPGDRSFNLRGASDEEAEAFNDWGDRMLDLRDRGFLEVPDGLITRNHQGGTSRYYRIGARRVTALGRQELQRHEPPAKGVVSTIHAKVDQDLADRRGAFPRKRAQLLEGMSGTSSAYQVGLRRLVGEEFRARGQLLLDSWREVLAGQNLVFTEHVAEAIRNELRLYWGKSQRI
jgi:hypothetical protein